MKTIFECFKDAHNSFPFIIQYVHTSTNTLGQKYKIVAKTPTNRWVYWTHDNDCSVCTFAEDNQKTWLLVVDE